MKTDGIIITIVLLIMLAAWAVAGCTANLYFGGTHNHGRNVADAAPTEQLKEPTVTLEIPK